MHQLQLRYLSKKKHEIPNKMKGMISYPCPNISLSMLVKEALDAAGSNEEQLEPLTDDVMNMTCVDLHHENWIA